MIYQHLNQRTKILPLPPPAKNRKRFIRLSDTKRTPVKQKFRSVCSGQEAPMNPKVLQSKVLSKYSRIKLPHSQFMQPV